MTEFTAPSGATIKISEAAFVDAARLKRAIWREVGLKDGFDIERDAGDLISQLIRLLGSEEIDALLWPCMGRCLYNGERVQPGLFDRPGTRQDYYAIVAACLKANLGPLLEGLLFELRAMGVLKKQAAPSVTPASK